MNVRVGPMWIYRVNNNAINFIFPKWICFNLSACAVYASNELNAAESARTFCWRGWTRFFPGYTTALACRQHSLMQRSCVWWWRTIAIFIFCFFSFQGTKTGKIRTSVIWKYTMVIGWPIRFTIQITADETFYIQNVTFPIDHSANHSFSEFLYFFAMKISIQAKWHTIRATKQTMNQHSNYAIFTINRFWRRFQFRFQLNGWLYHALVSFFLFFAY